MNKKMQLYNRLHKLNTALIITLGFAVNMASVKDVWYPGAVQNGSHRSNPPKIITPAKPRVII